MIIIIIPTHFCRDLSFLFWAFARHWLSTHRTYSRHLAGTQKGSNTSSQGTSELGQRWQRKARWDHSAAMGQRQAYGLGRDSTRHLCRVSSQQHSGQSRCSSSQSKTDKYTKLASIHIFCPFAIETAGAWHETAIEVTQEIGRRITVVTEDTLNISACGFVLVGLIIIIIIIICLHCTTIW